MGLPRWLNGKNMPANAGDAGDVDLIPGWGRSPGGASGNPLQYSCLKEPVDWGAWWATVHRVTKSQTWLSKHAHTSCHIVHWGNKDKAHYSYHQILRWNCVFKDSQAQEFWPETPTEVQQSQGNCFFSPQSLDSNLRSYSLLHVAVVSLFLLSDKTRNPWLDLPSLWEQEWLISKSASWPALAWSVLNVLFFPSFLGQISTLRLSYFLSF